jgi:exodeoxyribonuclease V gamma subunit
MEKLKQTQKGIFKYQLPELLIVFGINNLPPLWLQFLQVVSEHCEVHFYWLNALPDVGANLASLHPLLASLGQQGREFQKALDSVEHDCQSFKGLAVIKQTPATVLQQLQHDLSQPQTFQVLKTWKVYAADNSISIHACHSRMREVEVLKNQLLHTLEHNLNLQLREIIVTAPDIQAYAPFITAIFADIPHHIAGRRDAKSCIFTLDSFVRFLKLCDSRFGWQAVLDLLEQPNVYPNFDLSEADLELLKHWLNDTHVRWGKSAQHKQQLGLPPLSENTWLQSLERLLMGYAVGADDHFVDNVLPYKDLEGSSAQALGGLCDFIALLFNASEALTQSKTLHDWSEQLYHYADLLC